MNNEQRIRGAWRTWLLALGTDPEAAIAASHVYAELTNEGKDAFLDAIEEDSPEEISALALYAPVLAVETDPARLNRIGARLHASGVSAAPSTPKAFRGVDASGHRVVAVVVPLYGDFVHVLSCRFLPNVGFDWAETSPLVRTHEAPVRSHRVGNLELEWTPLKLVIEELALTVLAHKRSQREVPAAMVRFADLFGADLDHDAQDDDEELDEHDASER